MPQEDAAKRANIRLKPAQERVLAALAAAGETELTRADYERLAGVSRSQAAYDLAELVEGGPLERVGNGRATRYRVRAVEPAAQRRWTEDRIWAELVSFCNGRRTWPTPREFKEAGRGDLYVAASRYGGVAHWARALGVEQPTRNGPPAPAAERRPARLHTKLLWAAGGALAAAAVAGATVAALGGVSHPATPRPVAAAPLTGARVADESLHSLLVGGLVARARAPHARAAVRRVRERTPITHVRRSTGIADAVAVTTTAAAPAARVASPPAKTWLSSASSASSSGPTPLAAPSGGQAPAPIKAP